MQDGLLRDLRFAARSLFRTPRFTFPAVIALALGVGAVSAIFSIVRGVMLEPLPYRDPDRIVVIWENNTRRNRPRNVIGSANFVAWGERNKSFQHLGMVGPTRLNVILGGQPEEIPGLLVSSSVFPTLGVQPALGRAYTADDDLEGNDGVIILSHEFWSTRLGGRTDLVGSSIIGNGRSRTVVGIMPPGFTIEGQKAHFLIPYGWTLEGLRASPGRGSSHGLARLKDGVSLEQAESDMQNIAAQLEQEFPQRNSGWSVTLVPVHEQMVGQIRPALLVLSGAVMLVLFIACVNVANLLLARSTVRQRELSLRTALGAGRGRLVQQMLTESLLLSIAGGLLGLVLAVAFHRGLLVLIADRIPIPRLDQVALDLPVLVFTLAVALGTSVLFGLFPALVATQLPSDALREGARHGSSPRAQRALGVLVVAEVALSVVLLVGAGLLIRSFMRLQNINPGFRAENVLTARVTLPPVRYTGSQQSSAFFTNALTRITTIPGVQSAAAVTFLPLSGPGIGTSFYRADRPAPPAGQLPGTEVRPVTPGFFRTMGIRQLAGRDFGSSDSVDASLVAIVSETLIKQHFPGENPLGKRLQVSIGPSGGMLVEIVGVVGDIKMSSLDGETRAAVFLPHTQLALGLMTLVVRTGPPSHSVVNSVAAAVHAIDPALPLADVKTMDEVVEGTLARSRAVSVLLGVFSLIALALAAVGIYGVMAYSVSQRTHEIGVRMALGATAKSVFRLVIGRAMWLMGIGLLLGFIGAAALARVLETLLFDTHPLDPLTFAIAALVLGCVATLASYVPARRGTRIPPVEALRGE